jgi:hypothetical protein
MKVTGNPMATVQTKTDRQKMNRQSKMPESYNGQLFIDFEIK